MDVSVGEYVYAYHEETDSFGLYPVTTTFSHLDPVIITLTIDGEVIETTPEHPFYTDEGEWVAAGFLTVGDEILSLDGTYGDVEAITISHDPQAASYYGFASGLCRYAHGKTVSPFG